MVDYTQESQRFREEEKRKERRVEKIGLTIAAIGLVTTGIGALSKKDYPDYYTQAERSLAQVRQARNNLMQLQEQTYQVTFRAEQTNPVLEDIFSRYTANQEQLQTDLATLDSIATTYETEVDRMRESDPNVTSVINHNTNHLLPITLGGLLALIGGLVSIPAYWFHNSNKRLKRMSELREKRTTPN